MRLSPGDMAKVLRGVGWTATVTDLNTDRTYNVAGAPCSLRGCHCDAVITYEHPQKDEALFELTATGGVRLIILEYDLDDSYRQVKDIVEWAHGSTQARHVGRSAVRHIEERCGDDFKLTLPEGLILSPRITRPETKIERIILHLVQTKEKVAA